MTKDVFVSISGMHEEIAETPAVERDEAEAILQKREALYCI